MSLSQKKRLPTVHDFTEVDRRDGKETQLSTKWRERRRNELLIFLNALETEQVAETVAVDEELFFSIMELAIDEYGISQKKLAAHLLVNPAAISRWKSTEHTPPPYARKSVILGIATLIEERLSEIRLRS